MRYRPLAPSEIGAYIHDNTNFAYWQMVRDFAIGVYGPTAHMVKVKVDAEYNDEGGNDLYFGGFVVTDERGARLAPDVTLPFWAESVERYPEVEVSGRHHSLHADATVHGNRLARDVACLR